MDDNTLYVILIILLVVMITNSKTQENNQAYEDINLNKAAAEPMFNKKFIHEPMFNKKFIQKWSKDQDKSRNYSDLGKQETNKYNKSILTLQTNASSRPYILLIDTSNQRTQNKRHFLPNTKARSKLNIDSM